MPQQKDQPGTALRTLRQLAGMTLEEVASRAGTSSSYLSKVERGSLTPTIHYVAKVALVIADETLSTATMPLERAA